MKTELLYTILKIWTLLFYAGTACFIRSQLRIKAVYFYLGCAVVNVVLGYLVIGVYFWYVDTHYPSVENINDSTDFMDTISKLNVDNEIDTKKITNNSKNFEDDRPIKLK